MALSDVQIPLTAKKDRPLAVPLSRPKVFYLKGSDFIQFDPDTVRAATILRVRTNSGTKKVEVYEAPNEVIAMQALAQGATANPYFTAVYTTTAATGNTPALAQPLASYFNQVNGSGGLAVSLPDPFVKRLLVIQNTGTGPFSVFGRNATAFINGSTAAFIIQAGQRRHFLAPTAGTASTASTVNNWKTAIDV